MNALNNQSPNALARLDAFGRIDVGGPITWRDIVNEASTQVAPYAPAVNEFVGDMIPGVQTVQGGNRLADQWNAYEQAQRPIEKVLRAAEMVPEGAGMAADVMPYAKAGLATFGPLLAMMAKRSDAITGMARAPMARGQLGIIGSTGAKTADLDALEVAKSMKADGVGTDDIYQATGWWLDHPDGRPRFEIDDSALALGEYPEGLKGGDTVPMGSIGENIDHPALFEAYPELAEFKFSAEGGRQSGHFSDYSSSKNPVWRTFEPRVTATPDSVLHELQHAGPQKLDDMAKGGSLYSAAKMKDQALARLNYLNSEQSKVAKEMDEVFVSYNTPRQGMEKRAQQLRSEYDAIMSEKLKIKPILVQGDEFDIYEHLAGESEARLVQDRMSMGMEERLSNPFYKNYDVPLERQVVRMRTTSE